MAPSIEILIVGNEILSGRTMDRNSHYMIAGLAGAGFPVRFISVVGDDNDDLARAFHIAVERADIILVTGGLGPTSDDITVEAAARAFGKEMYLDERVLAKIEELFRRRNRFMSESNRRQAMIPEGAAPIENPVGTAPGIRLEVQGKRFYFMPGVPGEMQTIFDRSILPELSATFEAEPAETETVHVTGVSESELYDRIRHLPSARESFAYYPNPEGIMLCIRTGKGSPVSARELRNAVVGIMGERVYSVRGESIELVVGRMLTERRLTLGIAESCTGGLLAHRITNIPGSSAYLLCGVVAYSNDSKTRILGVDSGLIIKHGAVSAETAAAMAEGIRNISGADIGISTTGIAGPGGATSEKPVGLMYAGYSNAGLTETKKLHFAEDRIINKNRMSQAVLDILRLHLERGT
ncbi:MAG: competence/damage-inducible protein A [Candidatus Latescibacterota bacterium]